MEITDPAKHMTTHPEQSRPGTLAIIGAFFLALILVFGLHRTVVAFGQDLPPLETPALETMEVEEDAFDSVTTKVQNFFTELRSLRARFVQLSPDGGLARGLFHLARPGLLRFDYDPPATLLIIADGEYLYLHDTSLNDTTRWAIDDTPIGFLLSDEIQIGRDIHVREAFSEQGILTVTLYDEERSDQGFIKLIFVESPVFELKQWIIIDGQDQVTTLVLEETELNGPVDFALFELDTRRAPGRPGS